MEESPPANAAPAITSFVIRFVHPDPASQPEGLPLRGTILHVQTNQDVPFTRWEDAVTFIRRFVPLDADDKPLPFREGVGGRFLSARMKTRRDLTPSPFPEGKGSRIPPPFREGGRG